MYNYVQRLTSLLCIEAALILKCFNNFSALLFKVLPLLHKYPKKASGCHTETTLLLDSFWGKNKKGNYDRVQQDSNQCSSSLWPSVCH